MKTQVAVPSIFSLMDLNDREKIFIELLARINKYFGPGNTFRFYASDLRQLLSENKRQTNLGLAELIKPFNGLVTGFEIDSETWYVTPNWLYKLPFVEVDITEDDAIKTYFYLLGRTVGHKFEDENEQTFSKFLVQGSSGKVFGSKKGLLTYQQKRTLNE
jgi:hypothetical protein